METRFSNSSSKQMHTPPHSVTNRVENGNQPKHSSKGASFIKLLGPDFSKELQIPHEFTMIFNGYIPNRFIIETAMTKKCWRVEVEEEGDGALYIREGWADFVEAHSLQVGNFLLFQYEEQSIFQVTIYDRNGCQKMVGDAHQGGKHNPVEITEFKELEERESSESEPKKLRTISRQQRTRRLLPIRKSGYGTYKKKSGVVGRGYRRTAAVTVTGNAVAFSVEIHRSKMHQFYSLTIPKAVSLAKNLTSQSKLILQDATGNHWPVKLTHRTDGRCILSRGWKEFFNHNKGAPGDTLELDFISDDLVQARFMKASHAKQKSPESMSDNEETATRIMECEMDELDACTADVNPTEASTPTERSKKRRSELSESSFSFLWRPATAGTYLHIPKVVVEGQKMMNKDNVVLRDPEGKCWPLEVSKRRDGRVALTTGWEEFWKGHDMKAGDSFHFEFVSEYLIQANITRGKSSNSPTESIKPNRIFTLTDDDKHATQPEAAMIQASTAVTQAATAADFPPGFGLD